jgi:hypothetical protein
MIKGGSDHADHVAAGRATTAARATTPFLNHVSEGCCAGTSMRTRSPRSSRACPVDHHRRPVSVVNAWTDTARQPVLDSQVKPHICCSTASTTVGPWGAPTALGNRVSADTVLTWHFALGSAPRRAPVNPASTESSVGVRSCCGRRGCWAGSCVTAPAFQPFVNLPCGQ